MSDNHPVIRRNLVQPGALPDFDDLISTVLKTVGEKSKRVYAEVYVDWQDYADAVGISPFDLLPQNITDFLKQQPVGYGTRKRMLSSLRKLLQVLAALDFKEPKWAALFNLLRMIQAPEEGATDDERVKRALTIEEIHRVHAVWENDYTYDGRLNYALITLAIATGMRRAELLALKWDAIDFEAGTITVVRGKGRGGGKTRKIAIFGEVAIPALLRWQEVQQADPVFPISESTAWRRFVATGTIAGVELFTPHGARRTLITEMINSGMPLHEAQNQAGHVDGSTTLQYTYAISAEERRRKSRVRF